MYIWPAHNDFVLLFNVLIPLKNIFFSCRDLLLCVEVCVCADSKDFLDLGVLQVQWSGWDEMFCGFSCNAAQTLLLVWPSLAFLAKSMRELLPVTRTLPPHGHNRSSPLFNVFITSSEDLDSSLYYCNKFRYYHSRKYFEITSLGEQF